MIIYNTCENTPSSKNIDKYQDHIGFGHNHSRRVKVKTSPSTTKKLCKIKKRKLTKKNIAYLKSLGFKLKVN